MFISRWLYNFVKVSLEWHDSFSHASAEVANSGAQGLDKSIRQCVWGSLPEKQKIHLVCWEILCKSKEDRGLGLRRSEDMNKAMLTKLAWRLINEEEAAWCKIMRPKYGQDNLGPF